MSIKEKDRQHHKTNTTIRAVITKGKGYYEKASEEKLMMMTPSLKRKLQNNDLLDNGMF